MRAGFHNLPARAKARWDTIFFNCHYNQTNQDKNTVRMLRIKYLNCQDEIQFQNYTNCHTDKKDNLLYKLVKMR